MKKTSFLALLGKIFPEKLSGLSAKTFLKVSLSVSLLSVHQNAIETFLHSCKYHKY